MSWWQACKSRCLGVTAASSHTACAEFRQKGDDDDDGGVDDDGDGDGGGDCDDDGYHNDDGEDDDDAQFVGKEA